MKIQFYSPFSAGFVFIAVLIIFVILILSIPFILIGMLGYAFVNLGFTWQQAFLLLLITFVGSFVNIPVRTWENVPVRMIDTASFRFGQVYRIPRMTAKSTLAVNLGGAVIPVCVSVYLLYVSLTASGHSVVILSLVGFLFVSLVVYRFARPVEGFGISIPFFIPPAVAFITAVVLSACFLQDPKAGAATIAYVSGCMGTLAGADLLRLNEVKRLCAPMASIGGAGTFDGVFLSGLIAAFLL